MLTITLLHAWPCITIWDLRTTPITPLLVLSTLRQKWKFSSWRMEIAKIKWFEQQCSGWFTTCSRFSITSWCSWNKKWLKRLPKQRKRKFTMATSIYSTYIPLCSLICSWIQFMRLLFIYTLRRLIFAEINFSQVNFRVN